MVVGCEIEGGVVGYESEGGGAGRNYIVDKMLREENVNINKLRDLLYLIIIIFIL